MRRNSIGNGCSRPAKGAVPRRRLGPARCVTLNRFLQFLGGAEGDLLARLDLDGLAGRGVAAHAGGAVAHLQNAEPADPQAAALLEMLHDEADHVGQHRLALLLGDLVARGDLRRKMLEGDGRCGLSGLLGCHGCWTPVSGFRGKWLKAAVRGSDRYEIRMWSGYA